jgi:acylphosphatase
MIDGQGSDSSRVERLRATVRGTVQGVGFRYATVREALAIGGITGYVRNDSDGSVMVVAEGSRDRLQRLARWLERGPSGSAVRSVRAEYGPATGSFSSFGVEY